MNHSLTLGSLFDGSGGFVLGGLMCGIKPIWASEIEPFPIRVTSKRLPFMKHYGDINKIDGAKIEPVDIITFGSPCTDMSIAGRRAGLEGKDSVLFYQAIRIIKEMRCKTNGQKPRYCVWENVVGAFSSNKGDDFREVLEQICKIKDEYVSISKPKKWAKSGKIMGDTFSLGWRVLDAQYWGVPQRRKRIYLVADFRGQSADKILFESESVSGYSEKSYSAWKTTTENIKRCIGKTNNKSDISKTIILENHPSDSRVKIQKKNIIQTLTSTMGNGGGNVPLIMNESPKTLKIRSGCEGGGKGVLIQNNKSATLSCNNDQTLFDVIPKQSTYVMQGSIIGRNGKNGPNGSGINKDVTFTLNTVDRHAIYTMTTGNFINIDKNIVPPLMARDYKGANTVSYGIGRDTLTQGKKAKFVPSFSKELQPPILATGPGATYTNYIVRKLTPSECAKLQGFPDWWCKNLEIENPSNQEIDFWTDVFETYRKILGKSKKQKSKNQIIKWLNNPHSDTAEYKMWGNGVALPCVYFVLFGIAYYSDS